MTFVKKYTFNFKQVSSYMTTNGYVVDIYEEGHGGGTTELTVERDSVVLSRDGGQLEFVNGTSFEFGLINLTEEQFIEFRTATYGQYYVSVKRDHDSSLVFKGYLQSEIYTESYQVAPYTAKLKFTCGLSHLKYKRFDDGGTLYTGQKSLIEVIRLCLNKLPSPLLLIKEFVNIYEDSMTSTTASSPLNQTFVNVDVYREELDNVEVGFTCHHVLEEVLKCLNAHIYQWNEEWLIIRWDEYAKATLYYREFNANVGTESTITVGGSGSWTTNKRVAGLPDGTATELVIVGSDSELSIEPPLNRIKLTYNQDFGEANAFDLLQNGCFGQLTTNNYTGKPNFWTFAGDNPDTYAAMSNSIYQFADITASTLDETKYISQTKTNMYVSTSDRLRIVMRGALSVTVDKVSSTANFNAVNSYISQVRRSYPMVIKCGSYYLRQAGANNGTWTLTPSVFTYTFSTTGAQMPFWYNTFNFFTQDAIVITTAVLPVGGFQNIEMRFLRPYSDVEVYDATNSEFDFTINYFGLACREVNYEPDQNAAVTDYVVYQYIDEDEDVMDLDVIHGDGLYQFSLNSFRLSDGTITSNWNRRGETDNKTIFQQILLSYKNLRGGFTKNLAGKVYGQFAPHNSIEHTVVGATEYMIKDYSFKMEMNEWDLNLTQITDFSSVAPDITVVSRQLPPPVIDEVKEDLIDNQQDLMVIENSINGYIDQNDLTNYV